MCEITDVQCQQFPPVNGEVLVVDTTGDDPVWEPKAIGNANLGCEPLGGWPEGSVGDALQDITTDLPISVLTEQSPSTVKGKKPASTVTADYRTSRQSFLRLRQPPMEVDGQPKTLGVRCHFGTMIYQQVVQSNMRS